jgi:flagellar basal body-associated protein FliL
LSRDRRITNRKRNKLTIIAIAGVMTTATAASAAAAAWPSGSSANEAFTKLNVPSAASAAGHTSTQQNYLSVAHARAAANHQAVLTMLAHQAAAKAAAARRARAVLAARQAAARQAAQAAAKQAARSAQSAQSSSRTASATVPAPSGSAQTIAREMLASFGWSASQFSCLEPLWAHESGWSVTASNPSTGAYGIPQALPGSRMASAGPNWRTDAATQIKWGLGYIKDTYGSPCAAESHEQADGWY